MKGKLDTPYALYIARIKPPYPDDDLIETYSDFLAIRSDLKYYKFNMNVLGNLVRLADELWCTKKRISRISLLRKTSQYLYKNTEEKTSFQYRKKKSFKKPIPLAIRKQIFSLFQKTFTEKEYISTKQLQDAQNITNALMLDLTLTSKEETWLCENVQLNKRILNRVLRYPVQSDVISKWVDQNFYTNQYRSRRSEMVSWKLDKNPDFEVDINTMLTDFDYLNEIDNELIRAYENEVQAIESINRDLIDVLPSHESFNYDKGIFEEQVTQEVPNLNLPRRTRIKRIGYDGKEVYFGGEIMSYKEFHKKYKADICNQQKIVMIWAIYYARLKKKEKVKLFKKYYCEETISALCEVGSRLRSISLFRWMEKQKKKD